MEIRTTLLRIIPLSLEQFSMLLDAPSKLEAALRLSPSNLALEGHTLDAMRWLYGNAGLHPEQRLWYTNWQIVLTSANQAIGSACFKGGPNAEGEVELGYGIHEAHRNRGYMTEAAMALGNWAIGQPGVWAVVAETDKDNPASRRVCAKSGMTKVRETPTTIIWRLARAMAE